MNVSLEKKEQDNLPADKLQEGASSNEQRENRRNGR